MIFMNLKPNERILEMLEGYSRIVLFGDSGCAQLCDVGGILQLEDMEDFLRQSGKEVLGHIFIYGGICDEHALEIEVDTKRDIIAAADAFLVQACGIATQNVTMLLPEKEAFPATDSNFVGTMPERFHHSENCVTCGECILYLTGGICPIARCAKRIMNGPCGGSMDGICERDSVTDCVWQLIYDRLKKLRKLNNIHKIWEIRDWGSSMGPRTVVRSEQDE